jgi:hypothetical protein
MYSNMMTPVWTTPKPAVHFRDIATEAGLQTTPHSRSDRRYILDTMAGGGIALFDCDNDGKLDIAVVNDSTIERWGLDDYPLSPGLGFRHPDISRMSQNPPA